MQQCVNLILIDTDGKGFEDAFQHFYAYYRNPYYSQKLFLYKICKW